MILSCDRCRTRYLVPGHAIGAQGRQVRCRNCGHEWFQEPEEEDAAAARDLELEPIPDAVRPLAKGASVPAIIAMDADRSRAGTGRAAGYIAAAALFALSLGLLAARPDAAVRTWAPAAGLYDLLRRQAPAPGKGLAFENVTVVALPVEGGHMSLALHGMLRNATGADRAVPPVSVSLLLENGRVFDRWQVAGATRLPPGKSREFESAYPVLPAGAKAVRLDFDAAAAD